MLIIDRRRQNRLFVISILLLLLSNIVKGQEIKTENISIKVVFQYAQPSDDLNKYWGNSFGCGVGLKYKISDNYFLEGSLILSKLSPKLQFKNMPKISLIEFPATLKYELLINSMFGINLFAGITNNTFIFSGNATSIVESNTVESEFGYSAGIGIQLYFTLFGSKTGIDLFTKWQSVMTSPSNYENHYLGISFYLFQ